MQNMPMVVNDDILVLLERKHTSADQWSLGPIVLDAMMYMTECLWRNGEVVLA